MELDYSVVCAALGEFANSIQQYFYEKAEFVKSRRGLTHTHQDKRDEQKDETPSVGWKFPTRPDDRVAVTRSRPNRFD